MQKILIVNATILPMSVQGNAPKYFTGSVGIVGDRIAMVADDADRDDARRVERFRADNPDLRETDGRGRLVMPGLINTHTHVAMTLLRNAADDFPLMEWLREHVWPFEARLGPEEIAVGARLGIAEMLLGGTTTFVDMYWHEAAVARVVSEMGMRAVLCPSLVDGERMADFEGDLEETLAEAACSDMLSVRIAPHAAYSCSEANLRIAIETARRHDVGLHIHLSETRDEQLIVRERYGCTPTEHLQRLGFFERPTIAAHCVWVTGSDMDILRSSGVAVAHNPQSNMKLASGAAKVAKMMAAGVNVSLGTDGAASNNDLDMWDEMRSASLLGKLTADDPAALPAYEVLKMATVNGARAIGMEGRLGIIAEGALADIVMLDIGKPHWYPHTDLVSALVYSARSSDVEAVFVAGRQLVGGGKLTGGDVAEFMSEVQSVYKRVASR